MSGIKKEYLYFLVVLAGIIVLLIFKIPQLSLPYFWDEAFPYSYAIGYMYEHGLSMLPSAIPADLSTGHPLLFYFLEAALMKVAGDSPQVVRILPMLFSVSLIGLVFFFCKKFLDNITGVFSALLLMVQPVFVAQSSFVLPEIMVSLMMLLTLYFFLKRNWLAVMISLTILLFTKESGLFFIMALGVGIILENILFKNEERNLRTLVKTGIALFVPVALISGFYLTQKFTYGWFFFPRHTGFISLDPATFWSKLGPGYGAYLFIYYGRNIMTLVFVISVIVVLIRKIRFLPAERRVILYLSVFIAIYLLLSSFNFYSPRYILCVFPAYIILTLFLFKKAFEKWRYVSFLVPVFLIGISVFYCFHKKSDNDHNLGFADATAVQKEAINYCEILGWQGKSFLTTFLMEKYMTNFYPAYLEEQIFSKPVWTIRENPEFCILTSTEQSVTIDSLRNAGRLGLQKRFVRNNAWAEVYIVK